MEAMRTGLIHGYVLCSAGRALTGMRKAVCRAIHGVAAEPHALALVIGGKAAMLLKKG